MINALNLLWIVPICFGAGFFLATRCQAANKADKVSDEEKQKIVAYDAAEFIKTIQQINEE